MAYIIGITLGFITLIIIGLLMRKRIYDEVDRQENWKMNILDRNVASEISRIKKLNLSGETQEKFESWKERWEFIVEKQLASIEENWFEAENFADKYRFPSAKKVIEKTDETLLRIEKDIEGILFELNELMESEEVSRKKIEDIHPRIKALKTLLMQNRFQYGKAVFQFEEALKRFESVSETYNELTEEGNYLEAGQLVNKLEKDVQELEKYIEAFPALYRACKTDYPAQLKELLAGIQEMKNEGYRVEHLGFEKEIHVYEERLLESLAELEKNNEEDAKELIGELDERIKEMYLLLEKEAVAKNYVSTQYANYENQLIEFASAFDETRQEVEELKEMYYFDDRDLEKYLSIEKSLSGMKNEKKKIDKQLNETKVAHTELRTSIEKSFQQLETIEEDLTEFRKVIQNLRKDELEAKEYLSTLREQINETNRRIQKSNIPGVPHFIWDSMRQATEKSESVLETIENYPLDISKVQQVLDETKTFVDNLVKQTEIMLDQASLTEQVIQYANRYRSQLPTLANELAEAEQLFRDCEYELALEKAAKAIEEVEPGALKKIEEAQSTLVK